MVEWFLDEKSVEVQIFLGLYYKYIVLTILLSSLLEKEGRGRKDLNFNLLNIKQMFL
jgi:hypothetical protein